MSTNIQGVRPVTSHGTSGYTNHHCRCDTCRQAWADYTRQRRHQRIRQTIRYGLPAYVDHGASAYRNWGCRCDTCQTEQRLRRQDHRDQPRTP